MDMGQMNIVGVEVPHSVVPVRPGRNMTTIIEVAARNHLLKLQGHHSAQEFADRLSEKIARARPNNSPRDDADEVSAVIAEEDVE
jgi:HPr kinase/phosphorylase